VTLEDAGTITLQVGSCSSEAQLKVTGGHPYPTSALPSGCPLSPGSAAAAEGVRCPRFLAVIFEWGLAVFQCVVSQARIVTASWKSERVWLAWAGSYMEIRANHVV
jgi:hypothetical protein